MKLITKTIDNLRDRLGPGPETRRKVSRLEETIQQERRDKLGQIDQARKEDHERLNEIIDKLAEYHTEHGDSAEPRYAVHVEFPPSLLAYGSLDGYSQDILAKQIGMRIEQQLRRAHFVIPPKSDLCRYDR